MGTTIKTQELLKVMSPDAFKKLKQRGKLIIVINAPDGEVLLESIPTIFRLKLASAH